MIRAKLLAAILLALLASGARAQEHPHPAAPEKLGTVHFATSCNQPAQQEFNRAVALLHSFQFSRAITGFNQTLGNDPDCAIAYWGIALSDWSNPFALGAKDKSQLQAGQENAERGKTAGAKTDRERAYIAAVGKLYNAFESTPQLGPFARLSRRHAASRRKISRRSRGTNLLRLGARRLRRSRRQNVCRTSQGRSDSGKTVRRRADPPRTGALHHSYLRRAGLGADKH